MKKLSAIGGLLLATLLAGSASAATVQSSDWSVVTTFKDKGPSVCSLRFRAPRETPALGLEGRIPSKSSRLGAFFTLSALPPLLAGNKGTIRHIRVSLGGWSASELKADWQKGNADDNSKLTFYAAPSMATVINPIAQSRRLVITVPLINGTHTYNFDLQGVGTPMHGFVACLRG